MLVVLRFLTGQRCQIPNGEEDALNLFDRTVNRIIERLLTSEYECCVDYRADPT